MFGINEQGQTCALFIDDYQPFFYVTGRNEWTQEDANELLKTLKRKVGAFYQPLLLRAEIVQQHKLYGFTAGRKDVFVKLTFQTMSAMNRTKNLWYEQNKQTNQRVMRPFSYQSIQLQLYESNLPPILRYFHIHHMSPSGWVRFRLQDAVAVQTKTTTCHYEYQLKAHQLTPLPQKETRVPYKICSFDIEASSSHGDFPVPIKTYKRLATQMVDVYTKYMSHSSTVNQTQLIHRIIMTAFQYDHFQDVDLVYPKNKELITKSYISHQIEKFLASPCSDELEETNNILTIAAIFESMGKEDATSTHHQGDDHDDDVEADESEVRDEETGPKKKKVVKGTLVPFTLLASTTKTRDDKVQQLNIALMQHFPPLEWDKVTFIGSTFVHYGEPEPYLNHCLVLSTCAPVANVDIVHVATEHELLNEWAKLIQRENPDVIIGYNIFGFDYEFMHLSVSLARRCCHENTLLHYPNTTLLLFIPITKLHY